MSDSVPSGADLPSGEDLVLNDDPPPSPDVSSGEDLVLNDDLAPSETLAPSKDLAPSEDAPSAEGVVSRGDPATIDTAPSGAVPLSELSAALYVHADVLSMTEVLTSSLAGLLPADVVSVERRRTSTDRLTRRPGTPIALSFDAGDRRFTLRADARGRPTATSEHVVRGIRLSAQPIDIEQWIAALAAELQRLGAADQQTRDALYRFLLE